MNPNALDQLNGAPPPIPSAPAPVEPPPKLKPAHHHIAKSVPLKPAHSPAPAPTAAKPSTPPPVPVIKPLPPAIITFALGSAALPPAAAQILKPYCTATRQIVIDAYAPGPAADPSIALRLAFNRAFAVQAALTACGVPATGIIPRALGAVPGQDTATTHIYFSGSN